MPEATPAQTLLGPLFGGYGVDGLGYAYKTAAGATVLPPAASQHGSGAYEGRNPYDAIQFATWGVGGYDARGILPGTYDTYRRMRAHPTVALARATIHGPILAAGASVTSDEGSDEARELIERAVLPMRTALVTAGLFMLDYGFQTGELVWDEGDDGFTVVTKFKPLLPDLTSFDVDKNGNVIALRNGGATLPPARFVHWVYDAEGSNPYGRSRLENIRRTWCNYLAVEDQGYRLGDKVSGIQVHVGYPPDTQPLAQIRAAGGLTNAEKAAQLAKDLRNGKSVVFPGLAGLKIDNIEQAIALSKGTLWPITLLDMGDAGPSQAANLEDRKYYDQLLCRGLLRSERSVIEAQGGGTRAESADHTANISDTDCDAIHEQITDAINRQIVDPMLVENFGEDARGTVRLVPNQIVDESRVAMLKLLDAWLNDPMAFGELISRVDKDLICDKAGIKLNRDAEPWPEEMPAGKAPQDDPAGDPADETGEAEAA